MRFPGTVHFLWTLADSLPLSLTGHEVYNSLRFVNAKKKSGLHTANVLFHWIRVTDCLFGTLEKLSLRTTKGSDQLFLIG